MHSVHQIISSFMFWFTWIVFVVGNLKICDMIKVNESDVGYIDFEL